MQKRIAASLIVLFAICSLALAQVSPYWTGQGFILKRTPDVLTIQCLGAPGGATKLTWDDDAKFFLDRTACKPTDIPDKAVLYLKWERSTKKIIEMRGFVVIEKITKEDKSFPNKKKEP